jgi:hypothetical protein
MLVSAAVCALTAATTSACVKSKTSDVYVTDTTTRIVSQSAAPTGPVDTRAVTASDAASCPLLTSGDAAEIGGMRLARVQVLKRGTSVAGCRFYAIQGSYLAESEHLPGPNQPVIDFTSSRYATELDAHNALAEISTRGSDQNQYPIAKGVVGVAYRTRFDPQDGNRDWAVGFNKGKTLVVLRTARSDSSYTAVQLAQAVYARY